VLGEEVRAEDHDPEPRSGKAFVDLAPQEVTERQLLFIEPYAQPTAFERLGQRPCNIVLVLARMTDEDVELGAPRLCAPGLGRSGHRPEF
jgi:hypothetical protein